MMRRSLYNRQLQACLCAAMLLLACPAVQAGQQSPPAYPWAGQDIAIPLPENPLKPNVNYKPGDLNLSGVWLRSGPNSLTEAPPQNMTARGKALWDATITGRTNAARRGVPPVNTNDPTSWCDPYGFPRLLTSFNKPVEMANLPGRIVQLFEWTRVWRDIWMDGRELPKDPDPRWLGYSVGRWEGDTLVVETIGLDERSWLDMYGYRHSGNGRLVERYRRVDAETIELKLTLNDPEIYSEPWVSDTHTLRLLPRAGWPQGELREEFCVPSEEDSFNKGVRDPAGGRVRQ